jgi:lipoprotein-anchoring transpeptidase ErfK/SrfK
MTETTAPTIPVPTMTVPVPVPTPVARPARIAPRVTIGGVRVGGLTGDDAYDAVRSVFQRPLLVLVAGRRLSAAPVRLGAVAYVQSAVRVALHAPAGSAVPLKVTVHGSLVRAYAARLVERFTRKPVDAQLFLRNLKPFLTKDVPGRALDENETVRVLLNALEHLRRTPVRLVTRTVEPAVTRKGFGPVIVIRRGSNRLYFYEGMRLTRMFGVATGQAVYPTPLGRFTIVVKWAHPWWYPPDSPWAKDLKPIPPGPGNPLGTRWMGLSAPGVGIHGTPDDASIGYSASHGCIRMHIPDAEWLFNHVSIGTTVFIVGA